MKTIMIYEEIPERLSFIVLEGDYSHLNHVIINANEDETKINELSDLIFDKEGYEIVEKLTEFPTEIVKNEDCVVIQTGFYL